MPERTLPTGQSWFINKAKTWLKDDPKLYDDIPGFKFVHSDMRKGVCQGYTQTAMLLDWPEVKDLLVLINETPERELHHAIESVFERRTILVNSAKQAMLDWNEELIEKKYDSLVNASRIEHQQSDAQALTLAQKKRFILDSLIDQQFDQREILLLKLPAFFEAIMIMHFPAIFGFGLLKTMTRGQDGALFLPMIMPAEFAKKGGLIKLPSFSVCLTRRELAILFESLVNALQKQKNNFNDVNDAVVFELANFMHVISIKYYPVSNRWCLFDINNVNRSNVNYTSNHIWELTCDVFRCLFVLDVLDVFIPFTMQLAASGDNIEAVKSAFDSCMASNEWQAISKVTAKKATASMWNGASTWLYCATKENDVGVVRDLIANNADVNRLNHEGLTNLCLAADRGYLELVQVFLNAHALVNKVSRTRVTPLLMAAQNNRLAVVTCLLKAGAETEIARKEDEVTSLMMALFLNHIEVGRELLKFGANPNRVYHKSGGVTLLCFAVNRDRLEWLRLLLEAGAEVDKPADNNCTPLCIAACSGKFAMVQCLLEFGANPEIRYYATKLILNNLAKSRSSEIQARMRDFINTHHSSLFSNKIQISPYEIAKIMGHDDVAELINKAIIARHAANSTTPERQRFSIGFNT